MESRRHVGAAQDSDAIVNLMVENTRLIVRIRYSAAVSTRSRCIAHRSRPPPQAPATTATCRKVHVDHQLQTRAYARILQLEHNHHTSKGDLICLVCSGSEEGVYRAA